MSWKERVVETSARVLDTVGVSKESTAYVKTRMGALLDAVETRITGVPQVKDVEAMWYEAFALSVKQDELKRRLFAQEAITEGFRHGDEARFAEESGKLERLKQLLAEAHEAHGAAVAKAQAAQDKVLAARAGSGNKA